MTQVSGKKKLDYGVVKPVGNAAFSFKTSEHAEVEIGDPKAEQFLPKLALFKWNREVSFHLHPCMRLQQFSEAQRGKSPLKQSNATPIASLDKNKITHQTGPVDYRFYPLDPKKQMEDGGVEFEFTLNQAPDTNAFIFPIETRNLVFHYQPELTDEEKAAGLQRPENVIGSYAVYHARRGNMHNSEAVAQKYKTGKAFHIYRPRATDAQGNSMWATLNVDAEHGTLTVTVDQTFLDNAVYPVTVDPTIGYTSIGSTPYGDIAVHGQIFGGLFTTPAAGASAVAQKITAALGWSGTAPHAKCAIYKDSDRSFLQETVEQTDLVLAGYGWVDFAFSPAYALPASTPVDIVAWADGTTCCLAYDSGSGATMHYKTIAYGAWPNPIAAWSATLPNYIASIYCTYTGNPCLTVNASPYGTTSPAAGDHFYTLNQVVPVTATPSNASHVLNSWFVDGANVGSANPYNITMDDNHTLQPVILASSLGIALTDLNALVTWATPAHLPDTFYFGTLFGHFGVSDLVTESTYQNGLATTAGYLAALKVCRIAKVRGIPNAAMVTQQKAAMNALTFFAGENWPITGTYDMGWGSENVCLPGYYGFSNDFQLSALLNYLPTKWNNHLAWQQLEAACHAASDTGILYMNPINLHYYKICASGRFYDENALCINLLVELYMLDPDNNAAALTYALTLWTHINSAMWNLSPDGVNAFSYRSNWQGFECSGGFFQQIIMKLYAANGYSLTNFANILTDLHTRFLASGWASPQWNYTPTCYYVVVHMPGYNSQRRLENTFGAWISLHAFYPAMPTADKAAIVNLLNAATPAWKHLFVDSTLYDFTTTGKFRAWSTGTYDDPSTAMAMALLFLYGIVPDTGNLYMPLIHNDYEDTYTLNKYFSIDLTNHKIRIPVKAGNLIFIYGTAPLTVAFAEDGVYDVTFSADWNLLSEKTKVADLDTRLLYAVRPTLAGLGGGSKLYKHYTEEIASRGEDVTLKTLFLEDIVDDTTGWNIKSYASSTVKAWLIPKEERVELLRMGLAIIEDAAAVTQENIQDGDRIRDGAARTYLVKAYHDHYYRGNFIYRSLQLGRLRMVI